MTAAAGLTHGKRARSLDPPVPPTWVAARMPRGLLEREAEACQGALIRESDSGGYRFLRVAVPAAKGLADHEFRARVEWVYRTIFSRLRARGQVALRFWNYVPGIRARVSGGLSRYELFNLGRHEAFADRDDGVPFRVHLAAASAVDHRGVDLVVDVLASAHPGVALENPRQTPAYHYSDRYGPRPPCFSRATLVAASLGVGAPWVIVAGTASIVGEETRHAGDCAGQLHETLVNLAHISAASTAAGAAVARTLDADEQALALGRFHHLRVYLTRETDTQSVLGYLCRIFPTVDPIEVFVADLCRPELLVEVEGVFHPQSIARASAASGTGGRTEVRT